MRYRSTNKWQPALIIGVLLIVVYGMNVISQKQQEQAKTLAKEAEKARQDAEAAARSAKGVTEEKASEPMFALPPHSGPVDAPAKMEILINRGNSCHQASVDKLREFPGPYGDKLRLEWLDMTQPEVADRSDKLKIGCDAAILIEGKLSRTIESRGGKVLKTFRGPLGDGYNINDLYAAVNGVLKEKGHTPPPEAVTRAQAASPSP
jgi:hypothetical protein